MTRLSRAASIAASAFLALGADQSFCCPQPGRAELVCLLGAPLIIAHPMCPPGVDAYTTYSEMRDRCFEETVIGSQRQSSSIRQQREMSRKLKAAEKQAKRQSRTTEKRKTGTGGRKDQTRG